MKNNSKTQAQEQAMVDIAVSDEQVIQWGSVIQGCIEDVIGSSAPEEKIFYCDLTGVPLN